MILYLINFALLLMLMASTTYMVLVNRRLRALKSGQDEIGPTIKSFAKATGNMAETVTRLNTDATAVTQNLENAIARAQKVQGEIKQTLVDASVEARLLARDQVRLAAGDPPRERLAPDARERGRRAEASRDAMPDTRPSTGSVPDEAGAGRDAATTRELFATKKSDGPKSCRPWMPRRATDDDLRADAMQMFYGEPESA